MEQTPSAKSVMSKGADMGGEKRPSVQLRQAHFLMEIQIQSSQNALLPA